MDSTHLTLAPRVFSLAARAQNGVVYIRHSDHGGLPPCRAPPPLGTATCQWRFCPATAQNIQNPTSISPQWACWIHHWTARLSPWKPHSQTELLCDVSVRTAGMHAGCRGCRCLYEQSKAWQTIRRGLCVHC